MPDASPAKWRLAHTARFFAPFLLKPPLPDYAAFHPRCESLFSSYYQAVGPHFSRPAVVEAYR